MQRDWQAAVEAHDGRPCRVCLWWPRQLAHVIPRTFDRSRGAMDRVVVNPLAVVPLCEPHHRMYDAGDLNLEPHLKQSELDHAFSVIGKDNALTRIRGSAKRLVIPGSAPL